MKGLSVVRRVNLAAGINDLLSNNTIYLPLDMSCLIFARGTFLDWWQLMTR